MGNSKVDRATSDMLIGPDWAMNVEICDICNRDPVQAKYIVKGIKKRLGSKNPKVQLLSLTLLETIVKNCGEVVHIHVAEKGVLHEMVKIVKKKPDFHVKEKILVLIDTWQEAFGGPRARYPQYFSAYQDLLRLGAVFPQRSEQSAPVFTPPQTHPLTSYPQNMHNPESRQDAAESSAEAEFPTLSLTEIQNARGIMDVLAEMLNALDPGNKEEIRQEVIVDLVEQCRTYKQRVVHLVNSTLDESLLTQGFTLNDDLQRLLAKHEAIASGTTTVQSHKPKPETVRDLVPVDAPLIDTGDSKQSGKGSTSNTGLGTQLSLPAPPVTHNQSTTPLNADPKIDLLSGDDFGSSTPPNLLAIVPVGEPQPASPSASQQNALALVDLFGQSNNSQSSNSLGQAYTSSPQFHHQQNFQALESPLYPNGRASGALLSQNGQSFQSQGPTFAWNGPTTQQQKPPSPVYGAQSSDVLPPPPWEALLDNSQSANSQPPQQMQDTQVVATHSQPMHSGSYLQGSPHMANDQVAGMYFQPISSGHLTAFNNQAIPRNQMMGLHPQPNPGWHPAGMFPQPMQSGQMVYMYPQQIYGHPMAAYGYGQQQNFQVLEQNTSGLSLRDYSVMKNSSLPVATLSNGPSGKPSRPEDKLFGDLVDVSKFKPTKTI
ncbi:ENTH/VHS/GAT family protein [Forsythia ovata]|uniref:ENTH/VHS/GAT family protein n=1 Tax=Forsythia ovata TaxID=205694 RepID=A0ABD1W1N8_9LAMI